MKEFTYCFNQLRDPFDDRLFMNFKNAQNFGGVNPDDYFTADYGIIKAYSELDACDKLYRRYNADDRPRGYHGRSMSVSDIVELFDNAEDEPVKSIWFCDSFSFIRIDETGKEIK